MVKRAKSNLAAKVYASIKQDIFEFRLLPGQRFTESEVAARTKVSRTPVREALHKLEREGYLKVSSRSGWNVKPFDFEFYNHLYDLRMILETNAVKCICALEPLPDFSELREIWLVAANKRVKDGWDAAQLDEHFHESLVRAAGNPEIARVHHDVSERIRIIRRLDFSHADRIAATYDEHAKILRAILARRADHAILLLKTHIETSQTEVRKITLHKLQSAQRG